MQNWKIEATKQTPRMVFEVETHMLTIKGEAYPENIAEFSAPLFNWLEGYLFQLQDQSFTINIELVYFNSSTSKMLLDFFDILEDAVKTGKNIVVNWIYDTENDIALESGEEFQEDLDSLTFNLIEKG